MKTPMASITLCAAVMFLGACDKTTPAPPEPIVNQPGLSEPGPTTGSVANPPVPSAESVFPPGKAVDPALGETDGTRKPKQESDVKLMPGQNNDHSAPLGPSK